MRKTIITILHAQKNPHNNTVIHKPVYTGECFISERFSSREHTAGTENNSEITVIIHTTKDILAECGDRCEIEGKQLTIRKISKLLDSASQSFCHVSLSLR